MQDIHNGNKLLTYLKYCILLCIHTYTKVLFVAKLRRCSVKKYLCTYIHTYIQTYVRLYLFEERNPLRVMQRRVVGIGHLRIRQVEGAHSQVLALFPIMVVQVERRLIHVRMLICMYESMYVCMYVCIYISMYVCMNVYWCQIPGDSI